ncbi:MAG: 50S ribosomal protein L4 [Bacteroidales bacterium]|nr:50S ribosomal protein L4 [Bacteroidales bacterium]
MELTVYNIEGKDTGRKVNLNDEIFGIEPNDHAIYLDVKRHMANKRQGTHKAKERAEVRGSTRKIKKQKGTGSARAGSIKNPLFRGGGRVFGPRPRDYSFKLNKKVKKLARKSALTYKLRANELFIVEDFTFDTPKTKQYLTFEKNLKINDKKSVLVLAEPNKNLYLSSRNLQGSKTITVSELTTYDILNTKALVLSESSVDVLEKTF